MSDPIEQKFTELEHALTALAACGVSVQFAEIYQCGQKMTAIILTDVVISEQGKMTVREGA